MSETDQSSESSRKAFGSVQNGSKDSEAQIESEVNKSDLSNSDQKPVAMSQTMSRPQKQATMSSRDEIADSPLKSHTEQIMEGSIHTAKSSNTSNDVSDSSTEAMSNSDLPKMSEEMKILNMPIMVERAKNISSMQQSMNALEEDGDMHDPAVMHAMKTADAPIMLQPEITASDIPLNPKSSNDSDKAETINDLREDSNDDLMETQSNKTASIHQLMALRDSAAKKGDPTLTDLDSPFILADGKIPSGYISIQPENIGQASPLRPGTPVLDTRKTEDITVWPTASIIAPPTAYPDSPVKNAMSKTEKQSPPSTTCQCSIF